MELLRLRLESPEGQPGSGTSIKDILYPHSILERFCTASYGLVAQS